MKIQTRRTVLISGATALMAACAGRSVVTTSMPVGTGSFEMPGGGKRNGLRINVHYYRPASFRSNSPILIVLPGDGRNGDDYRDAWIPYAEIAGVLVAAPSYPEKDYDFAAYQMGGVIQNLVIGKPLAGSTASVVYLDDANIKFEINPRREDWLFSDFDRLFELIKDATGSSQRGYDMFGHSAGAQILHRHVLFRPESLARRIVAANAGLYTLPNLEKQLPVGLAGTGIDVSGLRRSLACELTVLLGESDNDVERGGLQLRTPLIDQTGVNRLARGRFFHAQGAERASALNANFRWKLSTVPDVGHEYRGMTKAAAKLLYG